MEGVCLSYCMKYIITKERFITIFQYCKKLKAETSYSMYHLMNKTTYTRGKIFNREGKNKGKTYELLKEVLVIKGNFYYFPNKQT